MAKVKPKKVKKNYSVEQKRQRTWCFYQISELKKILKQCREEEWTKGGMIPYWNRLDKLFKELDTM